MDLNVDFLRTLADSDALRARLDAGARLVVIGAGWIGAEVAASARERGVEVTVVAPQSVPLEPVRPGRLLVDARLETSAPGIFAAGHVANQLHPRLGRLRVGTGTTRCTRVRGGTQHARLDRGL